MFSELGAETIVVSDQPDGFNINKNCGSTNPELVQKLVKQHRADFGVSLDGDGDRVTIVDRDSNILDGDDILYILGFANPNRLGPWSGIVGTQMSNVGLEDGLKKLGYSFKRADVGDKYVSNLLSKEGWLLGGEPSGHIICRDLVSTGDGTIAALKTISSLVMLDKNPRDILSNYNKIPQINESISVLNKDIVSDAEVKTAINDIKSEVSFGQVCVNKENQGLINLVITKDGSLLTGAIGDAGGNRKRVTSGGFNDGSTVIETIPFSAVVTAGSTSQQQFTVGIMHDSGSANSMYINRGSDDTPDNHYRYRGASMIQVMEFEP
mgnify:CR=1 FL=1